ncbi:hypothetical protein OROGR_019134 [Orobanche gracilis]
MALLDEVQRVKAKQKKLEKKRKPITKDLGGSMESRELTPEEIEKKKKLRRRWRKGVEETQSCTKTAAANLQALQPVAASKSEKKKSAKGEAHEENPQDYVDPETPPSG